jgi:hypothetical protein
MKTQGFAEKTQFPPVSSACIINLNRCISDFKNRPTKFLFELPVHANISAVLAVEATPGGMF